jgi:hypothetical protein
MSAFTGRKNHGRGHSYWIDGAKVDGVTTVISKGLPKPALVNWAARTAAELAVDKWDELALMTPSARLTAISKGPEASRNAAGVQGTRVHALAERLVAGQEVPVPDQLAGYVDACVRFLDDFDVQPILNETSVFSRKWQYAGTLDLIAVIDGKTWLLDWKTNKSGPFGDTAFQLAAYRHAEFTLDDGEETALPEVAECGVVWLRQDGYDLHPYHADQGVFRQFLYIQQCARAADDCRDYKGDPMPVPVRTT